MKNARKITKVQRNAESNDFSAERASERASEKVRCFSISLIQTRRKRMSRRAAFEWRISRGVIIARDWRDIYAPISTSRLHVFDISDAANNIVVIKQGKNSAVN